MPRASERKRVLNLPNILTLARLLCVPVILTCLSFPDPQGSFLAALFFGIAAVTDFLDGFLARRYDDVTVLGKLMDPLADKILVSATMIMLIPLDRIAVWMVIVIIARELAMTGLRGIAVSEGLVIQASALGKYKTLFQSIALVSLCLHYPYWGINFQVVGTVFLWGALILTLWSGWNYFRRFSQVFYEEK
ncbi:MAG: CDP-diacylglycerol--glycerol-3-phosphate 3-phosphatidyltransferase [Deltaproteobacteria bacterium]|nr:CDP-diacylglycerol--glycerol-3-phosphate 3-phosphatidyltransferase [Deltaproteobacteria bacterium]